jgi:Domain of unknown function (DUF4157)
VSARSGHAAVTPRTADVLPNAARLQRRASFGAHASIAPEHEPGGVPSLVRQALRAPGRSLDAGVRRSMEARFGHDFSAVRIHTGGTAARAARALGADAFTVGRDIAFGEGRYDVATARGLGTLAHELTHVVQQGARDASGAETIVLDEPRAAESAAERNAAHAVSCADGVQLVPGPAVAEPVAQRQTKQDTKTPTKEQADAQKEAQAKADEDEREAAAWEQARLHITPELLIKFQEIGRVVAIDARKYIQGVFEPYEKSISTPNQTFLQIFLAGAGNVPQGEFGGFLGGAGAAALQALVGALLDTPSVADVKERARAIPEEIIAEKMTTDSPAYEQFEAGALGELRERFQDLYARYHADPGELRTNARLLQEYARHQYGASSERGQAVRKAMMNLVYKGMEPIREELDDAQDAYNRKRELNLAIGIGVGAGALAGGVLGGVLGARGSGGTGGGLAGAAIGALVGGLGVGALALGGAALKQRFTDTPAEIRARKKREQEDVEKNK